MEKEIEGIWGKKRRKRGENSLFGQQINKRERKYKGSIILGPQLLHLSPTVAVVSGCSRQIIPTGTPFYYASLCCRYLLSLFYALSPLFYFYLRLDLCLLYRNVLKVLFLKLSGIPFLLKNNFCVPLSKKCPPLLSLVCLFNEKPVCLPFIHQNWSISCFPKENYVIILNKPFHPFPLGFTATPTYYHVHCLSA